MKPKRTIYVERHYALDKESFLVVKAVNMLDPKVNTYVSALDLQYLIDRGQVQVVITPRKRN